MQPYDRPSPDEQNAEHWRPAATLLAIIGEKGGCVFFAELAARHGLRKGVKDARDGAKVQFLQPAPLGRLK